MSQQPEPRWTWITLCAQRLTSMYGYGRGNEMTEVQQ